MACMHGVHTIHMQGIHGVSMSDVTKHAQDMFREYIMYRRSHSYYLLLINCTSLCLAILEARHSLSHILFDGSIMPPFVQHLKQDVPSHDLFDGSIVPPLFGILGGYFMTIRKNSLLHETTASLLLSESIT